MTTEPTTRPDARTELREIVNRVAEYSYANRHRFRGPRQADHDPERVAQALAFHALHGTLAVVWAGAAIAGIAIAFQTTRRRVLEADAQGVGVFDWKPSDPTGDCVYLGLVVATKPGAVLRLANYFMDRFPHWRHMEAWAHRRGVLKVEGGLLERLSKGKG
jgi:hypothetical protein